VLQAAALDSDMAFGWFNSASKDASPAEKNFLGIHVGGPTRKGHMFAPDCANAKGDEDRSDGPVLAHGKSYEWSLLYDPAGNGGTGSITVTLGKEKVVMNLKPGRKADGGTFDRFGLVSIKPGGNQVQLYLDDLTYSASTAKLEQ
jgi:hypothetical protein